MEINISRAYFYDFWTVLVLSAVTVLGIHLSGRGTRFHPLICAGCAHLGGSDVAPRFAFFRFLHCAVASPSSSSLGLLPPRFFFPTPTEAHIRPYSTNPPSISPRHSTLSSSLGVRVWSYSVPWCTSSAEFALLLLFLVPPSPCSPASFPSSPLAVVRVHATTREWEQGVGASALGVGVLSRCLPI